MNDTSKEWLRQADYDMDTAKVMLDNGRHFYAVFMCHLSIEKALKGLYVKIQQKSPPKTHNLLYLLEKNGLKPKESLVRFITKLNTASIATRYPDDLAKLQSVYTVEITENMIANSREVLQWIKTQL